MVKATQVSPTDSQAFKTLNNRQVHANHPEQASRNLECEKYPFDQERPPLRSAEEADFAAEAHGFTGFERADEKLASAASKPKKSAIERLIAIFLPRLT